MKLTAFTDHCLRVLMHLAMQPGRRVTIAEIQAAFGVNESHLTKVVHHLGRRGWVATARGKGGGLQLARPAGEIRIGQVVREAEGRALPAECFGPADAQRCAITGCCELKGVLGQAVAAFYAVLDATTLADITRNAPALAGALHVIPIPAIPREAVLP